ncbi:MAG: hypothetical protein LBJ15_16385 [Comamonas sp.]|jgi:hypothetical protein|uniref:hypothetical protein n=1 Tax=Comamonas sp. TaxID=34028 RepID=UPI00282A0C68|nr:hypothetical protein [Comamonas sp.]MDR0215561.1 hypothetical protein [Comamonas sp.]
MKKSLTALLALLGIHQHLSAEQKQDIAGALYQATPGAVTAGGFRLAGLPLSDWLVLASIAFVALQAGYLVWKWRRDYMREADRRALKSLAKGCHGGGHE